MVGNIVDVGRATIKSGCLPITARRIGRQAPLAVLVVWFGYIAYLGAYLPYP